MQENKKNKSYYARLGGFNRAVPIILVAVALFIGLCFILKDMGSFGEVISSVLLGLFSYGAYAIPILTLLHAIFYPADVAKRHRLSRLIFSVVALLLISSSASAIMVRLRSARKSNFKSPRFATVSISNCVTTLSPLVARGRYEQTGSLVITTPAACVDAWRGMPSIFDA